MNKLNLKNIAKDFFNHDCIKTFPGQDKAWDLLIKARPEDVCKNALVTFDHSTSQYTVRSFGVDFIVSPEQKKVISNSQLGEFLLDVKEYFFELSIIWYLVSAKDVPASKKWVKPVDVNGGQIFFMGTHKLPLDTLAEQYAKDPAGFVNKGKYVGGESCDYADASVLLYPLPKIPVQLLLWLEDDEFPPRIDLMLDSTCDIHLPTDVIWSITNTTVLLMF